jgi:hypothetical protein
MVDSVPDVVPDVVAAVMLAPGVALTVLPAFAAAEKGVTAAADVVTDAAAGVIESVTLFGLIPNCCKVVESAADRAV